MSETRDKLKAAGILAMAEAMAPGALEAMMPKMEPRIEAPQDIQEERKRLAEEKRGRRAERLRKMLKEISEPYNITIAGPVYAPLEDQEECLDGTDGLR